MFHKIIHYLIGAASGSCAIDDFDCTSDSDYMGLEAIRSLHRQLDDDDNGDIDLSESDDVCYDSKIIHLQYL